MRVLIRKVHTGDAEALAYIQTESWKAGFAHILDKETLDRCTDPDRARGMYRRMLEEELGNGYILELDGKPHCMAYWNSARDPDMEGQAELICIHSLPGNWRHGYGSLMMDRVLSDIREAGYTEVYLWVFTDNTRARGFYEAKGFHASDKVKPALGTEEICYIRSL